MESIPKFLHGVYDFAGTGLSHFALLDPGLAYTVSADKRAQFIYLRAGNSSDELICLTLMRDGQVMRMFPIGAKAGLSVPLNVIEDLEPDTKVEVHVSAPEGVKGHVIVDIGLVEIGS